MWWGRRNDTLSFKQIISELLVACAGGQVEWTLDREAEEVEVKTCQLGRKVVGQTTKG